MEYDILLFCEIIESEGCLFLEDDNVAGENIKWYLSRNGKRRVAISVTDEMMNLRTAKDLLRELELEDLIDRMF